MEAKTLKAEVREKSGKGPARQLRKRGLIPAIFYGPGLDPVKLTVSPSAVQRAITKEYGRNQLLELEIGGDKHLALVNDLEVDPVTRNLLHVDFYKIAKDRAVTTHVPFETKGRALGVQKGAKLRRLFRDLPVRAFPQDVPAAIIVDVASFDMGHVMRVSDLELPSGVEVTFAPTRRILLIEAKETKVAAEEEEAEAAGAAPAAPAGAPA